MEQARVLSNDVTFIGLLTTCYLLIRACGRWMEVFHQTKGYGFELRNKRYACVGDILGSMGYLENAYDFIINILIEPGASAWEGSFECMQDSPSCDDERTLIIVVAMFNSRISMLQLVFGIMSQKDLDTDGGRAQ
ncbi:hypothetical protein PanWU01x14_000060 [Parasponia andersonii]|uniref:Pentatricopeptide repeat n=1 Tax=Parasponia andersonii TaxID=3476 RepID=A0A2P5E4N6_PARAD|nr:hypothetical protein PanWU01x14_000060 [Parasponia andersonii]